MIGLLALLALPLVAQAAPWVGCVQTSDVTGKWWPGAGQFAREADCSTACANLSPGYRYSIWQQSPGTCMCTNDTPSLARIAEVGATIAPGPNGIAYCSPSDWSYSLVGSAWNPFMFCFYTWTPTTGSYVTTQGATGACLDECVAHFGPTGVGITRNRGALFTPLTGRCECYTGSMSSGQLGNCFADSKFPGVAGSMQYTWYAPQGPTARGLSMRQQKEMGLCPSGKTACRIDEGEGYECLDIASELESCGGCLHGALESNSTLGVDCTALPGVIFDAVTCSSGVCHAGWCEAGWKLIDGACVQL